MPDTSEPAPVTAPAAPASAASGTPSATLRPRSCLHDKFRAWWFGCAADEASRKEITIYAAAGLGEGLAVKSIAALTMPILNMTLGVDPRYISTVGGIKTFWDAVTDPVFGYITDNFRSRWGRRRPFIALGGVLVGIMMFAIWLLPPGKSSLWYLYYYATAMMLLNPLFYSIGISATYTILSSMQADVVDVDELLSGQRREGMFGAVASVVMKSAAALAITISGFVLYMTGFHKELGGGQSAQTFLLMRIMFSFAPLALLLLVQFLLLKYPLTAQRMDEIHIEIKRRRAVAAATAAAPDATAPTALP